MNLSAAIKHLEAHPDQISDDSGEHIYLTGPDDLQDFACIVRSAYIEAGKYGWTAPAPAMHISRHDALYMLRQLASWLEGQTQHDKDSPTSNVLTPPQLAREWRVSPDKVLDWIRSGQLKARNVSNGNRPRYLISRADLESFRQVEAKPRPERKRRPPQDPNVIEFY